MVVAVVLVVVALTAVPGEAGKMLALEWPVIQQLKREQQQEHNSEFPRLWRRT